MITSNTIVDDTLFKLACDVYNKQYTLPVSHTYKEDINGITICTPNTGSNSGFAPNFSKIKLRDIEVPKLRNFIEYWKLVMNFNLSIDYVLVYECKNIPIVILVYNESEDKNYVVMLHGIRVESSDVVELYKIEY